MQLLKADTSSIVVIGPVVAVGDGFTPVATLAVSSADEAEILKHDAAAVTDISGNTFAAITSADGYYNLTITAAQLDTEGRLTVLINDDSLCLPVRADFMVVNANVYDSLYAAATTDYLDTQVVGMDANTVDVTSLANGAITSAKIATDAIGAAELAADAVAEIADAVWDEVLTGATHNVTNSAGRRLRTLQTGGAYEGGAIWVDTVGGTAGTVDDENGVVGLPVDTWADALTLSASLGLKNFHIANGSTVTLSAASENYLLFGHEWTLALGGFSIASTMIIDATVSGTGTGAEAEFEDCIIGTMTIPPSQYYNCSFTATQTLVSAGDYRYINCQSGVAGSGAPTFALGTGNMTVEFRRWSGGINFTGIGTGDTLTISGELGTVDLGSATAGTVEIRGTYKALTNASSGVTVNVTGAILGGDVATILVDTNELQTDWADGGRLDLILDSAASAGDPWSTALPGAYGAGTAGEIIGDWKNAGRLDAILDTIAADTTTDIPALIATAQADLDIITGASGVNLLTATQASIDAIETDTATTLPATLSTIAGYLDTEIAAILVDTGTSIPALIATAQADLDIITGASGVNLLTATQASIDAIEADTNELQVDDVPGLIAALNDISLANVATGCTTALTTALTEGYRTAGATASVRDMLYETIAHMGDSKIVTTTKTIRKIDGTTAKTFTLDSGTTPTDITEAT